MVFAYAICQCNPALWDFRSKKEFREAMNGSQYGTFIEIDENKFKYQRNDECSACGFPLKVTDAVYTKKQMLIWAKSQIGKELREKY